MTLRAISSGNGKVRTPFARIMKGGAPPGSWTPSQLGASVTRWYDASNVASAILDGSLNVQTWNDLSGNNLHMEQTTSGNRPGYTSGTSVNFTVAGQKLNALGGTSFSVGSKACYAIITTNPSNAGFRPLLSDGGSAFFMIFNTGADTYGAFLTASFRTSGYSVAVSTKALCYMEQQASNQVNGSTDGQSIAAVFAAGGAITGQLYIGGDTSNRLIGKIHELLVTDILSASNHQKMEGYLEWKWGNQSALPGGHPYKSAAP